MVATTSKSPLREGVKYARALNGVSTLRQESLLSIALKRISSLIGLALKSIPAQSIPGVHELGHIVSNVIVRNMPTAATAGATSMPPLSGSTGPSNCACAGESSAADATASEASSVCEFANGIRISEGQKSAERLAIFSFGAKSSVTRCNWCDAAINTGAHYLRELTRRLSPSGHVRHRINATNSLCCFEHAMLSLEKPAVRRCGWTTLKLSQITSQLTLNFEHCAKLARIHHLASNRD
jgi:hypothetical protein